MTSGTIAAAPDPTGRVISLDTLVIVTAYNEADRIAATLAALALAFPGAPVFLADDGSADTTSDIARCSRCVRRAQRSRDRQGRRCDARRAGRPAARARARGR